MAWNLSSGFVKAIQQKRIETIKRVIANTISFQTNKILDSANGLGDFKVGDWVHIIAPTQGGVNDNVIARVIAASDSELTFAGGSFTAAAAGSYYVLTSFKAGSIAEVLKNGTLHLYAGSRPGSADDSEGSATKLVEITLNGAAFTPGQPTNGLNLGQLSGGALKRAIDPETGNTEVWQGTGIADGTAGWGRWYANDVVTGNSTDAIRIDGIVTTTSGGDIVMANGREIVTGSPATVTNVNFYVTGV